MLRPGNDERIHVMDAIEELRKCSLIDVYKSVEDNSNFIGVPLAASIFGKDEKHSMVDVLIFSNNSISKRNHEIVTSRCSSYEQL